MTLRLLALAVGQMVEPLRGGKWRQRSSVEGATELTGGALTWRMPGGHPGGGIWRACRRTVRKMSCQSQDRRIGCGRQGVRGDIGERGIPREGVQSETNPICSLLSTQNLAQGLAAC